MNAGTVMAAFGLCEQARVERQQRDWTPADLHIVTQVFGQREVRSALGVRARMLGLDADEARQYLRRKGVDE